MSIFNIIKKNKRPALSHWSKFNKLDITTYPPEYGKYLIQRKDGKIHWETWNGSGWAYNGNEIRYWAVIIKP
jgi:hypothetical protein